MFRLDNILEAWAAAYKPLSHEIGAESQHRTFYRIDTINSNNEFVQNYNMAASPCMAYSTLIDASLSRTNKKFISYRHVIYFMVKQPAPKSNARTMVNDSLEATEAKYDADVLVQDLLAFLYALKTASGQTVRGTATTKEDDIIAAILATLPEDDLKGIAGLQLDGAEWGTLPVKYNHWWICGLEIEQLVPRNLCVVPERYR
jgi:hypothetical protein